MKPSTLSALALAAMLAAASPTLAKDTPNATATFTGKTIQAGVGYVWGEGVLTYKGQKTPFKVKGMTALGVGAETITGVAEVYHLNSAADFAGGYAVASAGGAIAKTGGGTAVLRNDKGVVVRFHAKDKGLDVNLAASGVDIILEPK
jgi:hypothetical protein